MVEKDLDGQTRVAVVGGCSPGQTSSLRFRVTDNIAVSDELPMQSGELIRKFASPGILKPGTVRLVGRVDGRMDGVSIAPLANQQNTETIVVAHLLHTAPPLSKPDENLVSDFRVKNTLPGQMGDRQIGDGQTSDGQAKDGQSSGSDAIE